MSPNEQKEACYYLHYHCDPASGATHCREYDCGKLLFRRRSYHRQLCPHQLQPKCYVLDTSEAVVKGEAPPVIGQSTFSVSGYLHSNNGDANSSFYGNMEVSDYPLSFTNNHGNISGCIGSKSLTLENRSVTDFTDETLWYYVEILKSDTDICVIHVFNTETDESYLLVCGESEDDAISNYNTYLDKKP